jgi:amino acid permease
VIFNNFNVRTFGRIEYWLTLVKIVMIVAVIFMGVLLAMGAAVRSRLLATDNFTPVACPANPSPGQCLGEPGFECTYSD